MIVLDRDVLAKLRNSGEAVVQHLQQYSTEERTIPSHVAWESLQFHSNRADMLQEQQHLRSSFDRILPFTDDTALEAAYIDHKLSKVSANANMYNDTLVSSSKSARNSSKMDLTSILYPNEPALR